MRNLTRILCGFLTFTLLEGSTAPQDDRLEVSLDSAATSRDPDAARARTRGGRAAHSGVRSNGHSALQLMSLSFDTWGSKTKLAGKGGPVEHLDETRVVNHLQADTSSEMESKSMVARLMKNGVRSSNHGDILALMGIAMVLLCLLACLINNSEDSDEEADPFDPRKESGEVKEIISSKDLNKEEQWSRKQQVNKEEQWSRKQPVAQVAQAQEACGRCGFPFTDSDTDCSKCGRPRYCDDARFEEASQEDPIQQVEFSDGSWARAFREARGQRRDALELLFKCNIISTQEFAYSRVSQEHIDECVWIGTYMLKQRPLEEWVALWQQAQQTFEDSVTACFTARTAEGGRSTFGPMSGAGMSGTAPRSEVPLLDCRTAASQAAMSDHDEDDPYTTRSSLCLSQLRSPIPDRDTLPEAETPEGVNRDIDRSMNISFNPNADPNSRSSSYATSSIPPEFNMDIGGPGRPALSPMILRCREILSAPPQEGVPAQQQQQQQQQKLRSNPLVLRALSSGSAGQIPVAPITGFPTLPSEPPSANVTPLCTPQFVERMPGGNPLRSLGAESFTTSPGGTYMRDMPVGNPLRSLGESSFASPSLPNLSPGVSPMQTPQEVQRMPRIQAANVLPDGVQPPVVPLREESLPSPTSSQPATPPFGSALPPQSFPMMPPQAFASIPTTGSIAGSRPPTGTLSPTASFQGKNAGPVVIRTLQESQSEAMSTAAPSSSQQGSSISRPAPQVLHGMPGQVKPPARATSGEVLVAHVPMIPQGSSNRQSSPVHISPLLQQPKDRLGGMASPLGSQVLSGSVVLRQAQVPQEQRPQ